MLEETEDIAGLPDIEGKGNQYSLRQAMLRDEIEKFIENFSNESGSYTKVSGYISAY